jgi:hypothetical protein
MDEFVISSSKHVIEFPLDAFGTKSSPAVMPFGQMMHGSPTSGAKVDLVDVVATVVSSPGIGVGAGVNASTVGVSVGVSVAAATFSSSAGVGAGVIASTGSVSVGIFVGASTFTSSAGGGSGSSGRGVSTKSCIRR